MSQEWILLALRLFAVAALYVFLWVVVRAVWRELRTTAWVASQRVDPAAPSRDDSAAGCWLQAVIPENSPVVAGEKWSLLPTTTIGRSADNAVVMQDESVSAFHARIDFTDGEWLLTDLDSRNGTRLNDIPISSTVPLAHGDLISFGQVTMKYVQDNLNLN